MANDYCRHLTNSFRFVNKELQYQPCCWTPLSPPVINATQISYYQNSIMSRVLANREKYCQDCIKKEKAGIQSLRLSSFEQIPHDADACDIIDLSIQIDTTCNAACSICGPDFSSLWRKEINPTVKLEDTKDSYTKLVSILDLTKVNQIRFYGGEPLVNDNHLIVLNAIKNPENVTLSYSSNGSIYPDDKTIKAWSKFKKVGLIFSIDDIEDRFHYIRWPLPWNKVNENIKKISSLPVVSAVGVNSTINPMNIIYYDRLERWFYELKTQFPIPGELHVNLCYGTWSTTGIPEKLYHAVIKKYGADHTITQLILNISLDPRKWSLLINDLEKLDSNRNLDYKKTFSEVFDIIYNN